jgi:hypothetical protein
MLWGFIPYERSDESGSDRARAPPVKVFGDRRAALSTRDLSDPDQVFELARAIVRANDRRLMQVSVAETARACEARAAHVVRDRLAVPARDRAVGCERPEGRAAEGTLTNGR